MFLPGENRSIFTKFTLRSIRIYCPIAICCYSHRRLNKKERVYVEKKAAALEYGEKNIRVNVVSPGWVETPLTDRILKIAQITKEKAVEDYPLKRMATPEEIAKAVIWLCSPEAAYVSGEDFSIDGGGLG